MKNITIQFILFLSMYCLFQAVVFPDIANASEITSDKVLELVNKDREINGLNSLIVNALLEKAANAKLDDMEKNDYFAHISPQNVTPWYWIKSSGYEYRFAGENLAIHFSSAEEQERMWMESPKHRENILNPKYTETGIAAREVVSAGKRVMMTVQMFATPIPAIANQGIVVPQNTASVQNEALVSEINSNNISMYYSIAVAWLRGMGIVLAVIVLSSAFMSVIANRHVWYYRWFHNRKVFQYRI